LKIILIDFHLQRKLRETRFIVAESLKDLGPKLESDDFGRKQQMVDAIIAFTNTLNSHVKGSTYPVEVSELYGSAKIRYILENNFVSSLQSISPLEGITDEEIFIGSLNSRPVWAHQHIPEVRLTSFEICQSY